VLRVLDLVGEPVQALSEYSFRVVVPPPHEVYLTEPDSIDWLKQVFNGTTTGFNTPDGGVETVAQLLSS
jgi:hypothetical protein